MAAPDVSRAMEVPGRLAFGCTNLAAAWPHGGTGLGFNGAIEIAVDCPVRYVTAEEWGNEVVAAVSCGEAWFVTGLLREWDDDALQRFMLNTAAGATSQRRVIVSPSTNRAGYEWSARATNLVFTPESVIAGNDDQHQMAIFDKAIPHPQRTVRLQQQLGKQWGLAFAFVPIRTAISGTDYIARHGYRKDLAVPS